MSTERRTDDDQPGPPPSNAADRDAHSPSEAASEAEPASALALPALSRRAVLLAGAAGSTLAATARAGHAEERRYAPGRPGRDYLPVTVPNGAKLPFKLVDGVKVFHLVAEEVEHEIAPGLSVRCWGYNGRVHGPVIEAMELDRVRIYVTNRLPAPTTAHWHGILVPNGMDGVGGLTQEAIQPGETFKVRQN